MCYQQLPTARTTASVRDTPSCFVDVWIGVVIGDCTAHACGTPLLCWAGDATDRQVDHADNPAEVRRQGAMHYLTLTNIVIIYK